MLCLSHSRSRILVPRCAAFTWLTAVGADMQDAAAGRGLFPGRRRRSHAGKAGAAAAGAGVPASTCAPPHSRRLHAGRDSWLSHVLAGHELGFALSVL